ncbi:MAG: FtsQ-type POTRA domain-containing protein [Candidatus Omnitrophica bacterium]|nr:FtsQ-type POTRA domain-containing protein [Candidatus Omnitrophota bacterium]
MGRRRGRPRSFKRRIPKIPFPVVVALLILIFTAVAASYALKRITPLTFFRVKTVRIDGNEDGRQIKTIVSDYALGKSLLSLDLKSIRTTVMQRYPDLEELTFLKEFPDTVDVNVLRSKAFLQIKSDRYYILNEALKIIEEERGPRSGLVTVEVDGFTQDIAAGAYIDDERVRQAARLLEVLLRSDLFSPTTILAHRLDNLSFFTHGTKVILGEQDFEKKLKILEALMRENYDNDFSTLRYIDLRYSKVYIGKR